MRRDARRRRRWAITWTLAVAALAAQAPVTAMGFDKVDRYPPQGAGTVLAYYIRERNPQDAPRAGRQVTMRVQSAPGTGARVAASDATHHQVGALGLQASTRSGSDGRAYFTLELSPVPGENQFVWDDTVFTGEVVVVGTAVRAGAHAAPPHAPAPGSAGGPGPLRVAVAVLVATLVAARVAALARPALLGAARRLRPS
jgi:hypothetical protein